MLSPRRPSKTHEAELCSNQQQAQQQALNQALAQAQALKSSGSTPRTPIKRLAEKETNVARSPAKRSPRGSPGTQLVGGHCPQTAAAVASQDVFITSSPTPRRKHVKETHRTRAGRVSPVSALFSPPYPATVGIVGREAHTQVVQPTSPASSPNSSASATPLSPVRRSLQENLARYGHIEQEFDEYEVDQFDPYQFIASLQSAMPPSRIVRRNAHLLPPRKPETPRMTLVLDLDETLVHCSTDPSEIPNPDFCFHVEFNGVNYSVCAKRRPGFEEFMEHIKDRFEIVVFTASQRVYAEKLMDILDPYHECIMHRLYRDDCLNVEGNYLKDLASLGRDLTQTVIVDNSPQAFSLQLDNGIPILSWWSRPDDRELFKVCPLLDRLSVANDVRPILREKFQLFKKVEAKMLPCNTDSVLPPKALDYY